MDARTREERAYDFLHDLWDQVKTIEWAYNDAEQALDADRAREALRVLRRAEQASKMVRLRFLDAEGELELLAQREEVEAEKGAW